MAKTNITKQMENAIKYYEPAKFGGVVRSKARMSCLLYEFNTKGGENRLAVNGYVDAIRIEEGMLGVRRQCLAKTRCHDNYPYNRDNCKKHIPFVEMTPDFCNYQCQYGYTPISDGKAIILVTCFEVKSCISDFRSLNGHNFFGNCNYYVMPNELYSLVKEEIPEHIGVIGFNEEKQSLRIKKDCIYHELELESINWILREAHKKDCAKWQKESRQLEDTISKLKSKISNLEYELAYAKEVMSDEKNK